MDNKSKIISFSYAALIFIVQSIIGGIWIYYVMFYARKLPLEHSLRMNLSYIIGAALFLALQYYVIRPKGYGFHKSSLLSILSALVMVIFALIVFEIPQGN